jgi:hypothetical protein
VVVEVVVTQKLDLLQLVEVEWSYFVPWQLHQQQQVAQL